jgi:hypothetical protein
MTHPTIFHLISNVFGKANIRYVLIGGFAVNYYKVSRQTADVDFLLALNDLDLALEVLKKSGYREIARGEAFARLESEDLRLMNLDLLVTETETLDRIIAEGKETWIAGLKFIVPSLEHLIAMKLHSIKNNPRLREYRDLPDIINLIEANQVDVKNSHFSELCLKYGTQELYQKIKNSFK